MAGLVDAVDAALAGMSWLKPSDAGAVHLAREYAEAIEDGDAKVLGWMGPHLMNTLRALGGAPAERAGLHVEETVSDELDELRAARLRKPKAGNSASA